MLAFLRSGYVAMGKPSLTVAFNERFGTNKSEMAIKAALNNHKITCGRKGGVVTGTYTLFSREQVGFIRDNYPLLSLIDLTAALNHAYDTKFTAQQLKGFTGNHKITSGRTGCFEKGAVSWNKGVKGYMGANVTSFKKGQIPNTKRRLWSERINADGFIEISIPERNPHTGAPTRFKHKHVWLWELEHGPVPKSHAVVFIDGNPLHCEIGNLMMITRNVLLSLNLHGYKNAPAELKPTILALAEMETVAGIRTKPGRRRNQPREKQ